MSRRVTSKVQDVDTLHCFILLFWLTARRKWLHNPVIALVLSRVGGFIITSPSDHIKSHHITWNCLAETPSHHVAEDDDDDDDEHLFLLCLHVIPHVNQSLCCHTREKFFHTSPCFVARRRVRTLKVDQPTQSTQAENKERTPNR